MRLQVQTFLELAFVRSGYIYITHTAGTLGNAGFGAEDWSSRGTTVDANGNDVLSAYYLYIPAITKPSQGPYARYGARSLRCLSTVLDI